MLKKTLALLLVLVMTVGVLAGCNETKDPNTDNPSNENGELNFNGETLDVYLAANNDLDVEGSYADQIISKAVNLNLVFHELDNFDAQYNPMLAEKKIPSLTLRNSWTVENNKLGEDGAMINIYDHLDKMPNVKAFMETEDGKLFAGNVSAADGVLYAVPLVETGKAATYGYIYRKDVFDANNTKTTSKKFDSVYNFIYVFTANAKRNSINATKSFK